MLASRTSSLRRMSTHVVTIGKSVPKNKVNSLGLATRQCLASQLDAAVAANATSIVLHGQNGTFSAGADITEFASGGSAASPSLHELIGKIEALPVPTVAAIEGVALGGGLELALSCKYRVGKATARVGLPEVHLGIVPGAGGTQRLPRLAGVPFALQAITSGRMIKAEEAGEHGVLDGIAGKGEDVVEAAKQLASSKEGSDELPLRNLSLNMLASASNKADDDAAVAKAKSRLPAPNMGGEAVHGAVDAIAASYASDFDAGMETEMNIFMELLANSAQGRARRHAFFAERFSTAPPPGAPPATKPLGNKVGVIGAGTMGSGIATCFLRAGYNVTLVDVTEAGLARGDKILRKNIETDVKKGRSSEEKANSQLSNFSTSLTMDALKDADLVVEAAFESMDIKKKIFKELDGIVSPSCILATNTSTLDIDEIGSVVSNSDRTMGMHFFSPANVMKLVENVKGSATSPQTISDITAHSKKIGKVGVLVGNCDGFVGNRMVAPYTNEAAHCVEDGASVEDVDGAMTELGMAIGPFTMGDIAGNDIGVLIRKEKNLVDPATRPAGLRYTEIADKLVLELERVGQKVGKGWYDYDPAVGKGRIPQPSEAVADFVEKHRASLNIQEQDFSSLELQQRNLFPLVNEGLKILEEYWKPSDLLKECVERDVSLYDYFDKGMGKSKL
ncbi:hypothetical protein TeGR_g9661 [Tetraparma gracilis]|uniref:Enoyl-CoA hydratase n=1 Tax=Tetraparma gracilis TaxID=2962635 RepID=A0ABQ6N0H8_9STRA|nr:hypothetical protein TeGR_g9661 [Tetraparma gracilis]